MEAERILGAEHRSTLAAVNNHASVLSKIGQTARLHRDECE